MIRGKNDQPRICTDLHRQDKTTQLQAPFPLVIRERETLQSHIDLKGHT